MMRLRLVNIGVIVLEVVALIGFYFGSMLLAVGFGASGLALILLHLFFQWRSGKTALPGSPEAKVQENGNQS